MADLEYKKRNIAIWNEIAARYHKRWASTNSGPFQSTEKLIEMLDVKKGGWALDVACGTGVVTNGLHRMIGNTGRVIGIDTSFLALNIAKRWNSKKVNFVNMDAEKFRFECEFDLITCQYALFFFPNAAKALENMKKNLKKSGKLGISVHGKKVPFFTCILNAITEFIPDYLSAPLDKYETKSALRKEVNNANFSKIKVKDFVFTYSPGIFEDYWQNYIKYVAKPLKDKLNSLNKKEKIKLKEKVRKNTKPYTNNGTIKFPWQVLILTAKTQ